MRNTRNPYLKNSRSQCLKVIISIWRHVSCLVHNFLIYQRILKIFSTNVYNKKTMCHAQYPDPFLQDQVHTLRSKLYGHILCPVHNFFIEKGF
jgi:hypothetical protein